MRSLPDDAPKLSPRLAVALVFLASGAVLVLEIVGLRLVGPYVGLTLQTSSAVIGVALAAIAYGAWTGGWLADRMDPRRLLGPALVLASVTTALVLPITRGLGELVRGTGAPSVLLLTTATLFIPSVALSAITPLIVKTQLTDLRNTGRVVGRLSSVGTLGAITATLGTGFVLVAALESSVVVLALAAVLAVVGLGISGYDLRRRAVIGAALVLLGTLVVITPTPCDVETAYYCARVTVDPQRPSGRTLWLNSGRHSYVDLEDPSYLEFAYTKWMAALTDSMQPAGGPMSAVHLGGGGMTLPRYLAATRPGTRNLVLELDAKLVDLDREKLGLRTGPLMQVRTGDGRVRLHEIPTASQDLVIGDAFGHLQVPWHLATRELVQDVERVLRPGGVYAVNVIDNTDEKLLRSIIATIRTVFGHIAFVGRAPEVRGVGLANYVVYASGQPLPLTDLEARLAGVPETGPLRTDVASYARDALVLTDDFAPVDRLRP